MTNTDCPDCQKLIVGYGAPDRNCDKHWREDHPNGYRITYTVTDVNPDVWRLLTDDD